MSLEKIKEPKEPCFDPEHNPPGNICLSPGTYKHTCPSCGQVTIFEVPVVTCEGYEKFGDRIPNYGF